MGTAAPFFTGNGAAAWAQQFRFYRKRGSCMGTAAPFFTGNGAAAQCGSPVPV
jgi:hypothetical protein